MYVSFAFPVAACFWVRFWAQCTCRGMLVCVLLSGVCSGVCLVVALHPWLEKQGVDLGDTLGPIAGVDGDGPDLPPQRRHVRTCPTHPDHLLSVVRMLSHATHATGQF